MSSKRNCVKKYVKCPRDKRCRVKTGRCISSQPEGDVKYTFAGKKFYLTPGKGQEEMLEEEYDVVRRRSTRARKPTERLGVVTGSKYRRGLKKVVSNKEKSLIKKFKALDLETQDDLLNASDQEFELTISDLDKAAGFIFPEVPFQASPTGMSTSELKLLKRLRALELPLGLPPSPPHKLKGSRIKRTKDTKLDVRRLALMEHALDLDFDDDYYPTS